ncbi:MAG: lipid A biosynthesis acyltransferase [Alphaproteobacteria bacterium]|nr:lipid A biosynthesis acyltransferase [Alphaproteobacteria bacterium]
MSTSSRLSDLRFKLEYYALRIAIAAVRAFPLETATAMSAWTWSRLAPVLNPKRHQRALDNLRIAFPDKPEQELNEIRRKHWENLGRVMAETMQIDRIISDPARMTIKPKAMFERYKSKLGSAIGISLHMGNWELAIWPLAVSGANPAAIYRSVTNPYVDQYLRDQRKDLYPGGLFGRGKVGDHGDDRKTARIITDYVRKGGRLGMVCDLYDRTGIPIEFFGKPAKTQAIGAMIARRVGARIWLSRCRRIGTSSRFEIELHELRAPRTANQSADIQWIMNEMQQTFEKWIRENPDQWMWSNRRWS